MDVDGNCLVQKEKLNLMALSTAWYGTVRHGSVRYGTAQFGSVAFPPQFSTAIEWAGLFTRRYNCAASTAVTSSYTRHKQLTTKKGDGIVFFILGMWMFLTAMRGL